MNTGTVAGQIIPFNPGVVLGAAITCPVSTPLGEDLTAVVAADDVVIDPVVAAMEVISHNPEQKTLLMAAVIGSHLGGDAPPPKEDGEEGNE